MSVSPKEPTDVDKLVGERLATLRKMKGLSQTELGQRVNVTFQQVQKYESGKNRISASRLASIAALLEVPMTSFFESPEEATTNMFEFMRTPGAYELMVLYRDVPEEQRKHLLGIARAIANPAI